MAVEGNYIVVRIGDEDTRVVLGREPAYQLMPDSGVIRVWYENQTMVIGTERLVLLCMPNVKPR